VHQGIHSSGKTGRLPPRHRRW